MWSPGRRLHPLLVLVLLALGLVGAAAVGNAVESRPSISDDAEGAAEPEAVAAHPGRSMAADCVVDSQATPEVSCLYTVTVRRDDPIIDAWRASDLGALDLATDVLGLSNFGDGAWSYSNPTLQYAADRPTASLTFAGSAGMESDDSTITFVEARQSDDVIDPDAVVRKQLWQVRVTGAAIVGMSVSTPRSLDAHRLVTDFDPLISEDLDLTIGAEGPAVRDSVDERPDRPQLPQGNGELGESLSNLYWTVGSLLPWIALAVLSRRFRRPEGELANRLAVGVLLLTLIASIWLRLSELDWWPARDSAWSWLFPSADSRGGAVALAAMTFIALPIVLRALLDSEAGRPRPDRQMVPLVAGAAILVTVVQLSWPGGGAPTIRIGAVTVGAVLVLLAAAALPAVIAARYPGAGRLPTLHLAGAAVGIGVAVSAATLALAIVAVGEPEPVTRGFVVAVAATFTAPVISAVFRLLGGVGRGWRITAIVVAVLAALPPIALVASPLYALSSTFDFRSGWDVGPYAIRLLGLILFACAISVLRTTGGTAAALRNPFSWAAALVLVLSATAGPNARSIGDIAVPLLALALFVWWFRGDLSRGQLRLLGAIGVEDHRALLRAALRRRLLQNSAQDLYRAARAKVASGETDLGRYDSQQAELDDAATGDTVRRASPRSPAAGQDQPSRIAEIELERAALGSHTGRSPWQEGRAAAGYALLIGGPIIALDAWAFATTDAAIIGMSGATLLSLICYLLRWVAYGFLFGYFYPIVRGANPTAKARTLMLTILVPEVLQVVTNAVTRGDIEAAILPWLGFGQSISGPTAVLGVAVRAGQVIAFCIAMGLCWERRLCIAGGIGWGRLRNFRNLRAFGGPVTAVIVAAATTAATALATYAVASVIATSPAPEPSKTSGAGNAATPK